MDQSLNIITAIYYTAVSAVQSYNPTLSGLVRMEATGWKALNYVKGSAAFQPGSSETNSGRLYSCSFSANLKEPLRNPGPVIVRIEFESGDIRIVGDQDLPVRFTIDESLTQKNIKFSHKSWHYPYKLVQ